MNKIHDFYPRVTGHLLISHFKMPYMGGSVFSVCHLFILSLLFLKTNKHRTNISATMLPFLSRDNYDNVTILLKVMLLCIIKTCFLYLMPQDHYIKSS